MIALLEHGPLAQQLGRWLAEQSTDGLLWPVDDASLLAAFTAVELRELEDAIAELERDGYVTATQAIGLQIPRLRPTLDLYATFDPVAVGSDPTVDACTLITMILDKGDESVGVPDLHERTGWSLRRFNPPLGIVTAQIDERRVSQAFDGQYVTRSFFLLADDRRTLKDFVKRFRGERCSM